MYRLDAPPGADVRRLADAHDSAAAATPEAACAQLSASGLSDWRERAGVLVAVAAYAALSGFGGPVLRHLLPRSFAPLLGGPGPQAAHVNHPELVAAVVVLLTVPGAILAEAMAVGWRASSLRQMLGAASASMKTDVAFLALSHVQFTDIVGKVMVLSASMATGVWLRNWIAHLLGVSLDLTALVLPAQIAIYFVLFTFLDYWAHRLYHTPVFWPLHRFHHAATDFSVINAERAHPAAVLGIFLINLPMAALGASPLVLIYVNALAHGQSLVTHSRIDSDWGWFGRWVLQSPNHHRMHHKLDISRPTGNFSMTPIWDRLFGTLDGQAGPSLAIGVDAPYRHGLWIWPDIWRDFREFCLGLARARYRPPATLTGASAVGQPERPG